MILFRRLFVALFIASLSVSVFVTGGLAQDSAAQTTEPAAQEDVSGPDYIAWEKVAVRAEQALEANRASDQALQNLRAELVGWRETFSAAKDQNTIRISTLQTQIATLGPAPAEGATEPAILTQRRDELNVQLEQLEAPVKAAALAFSRVNSLISEIDGVIRARQTDLLLQLGPTPVNPALWPKAFSDLGNSLKRAWSGVTSSWGSETQRAELRRDLPLTVFLGVIAMVLMIRGRAWVIRLGAGVRARSYGPARDVWGFVLSLGQVAAPFLGVLALVEALHSAGILGLRAQLIVDSLPLVSLCFFTARWLGNRLFGVGVGTWAVLNLPAVSRTEGRVNASLLGVLYGLSILLERLGEYETYSETTQTVLAFPILLGAGFLLFRLGRLVRNHAQTMAKAAEAASFRTQTQALLGRILQLLGVAGPLAAAVGYNALAASFVFPTVLSAALVAALTVLNQLFINLYGLVFRTDGKAAGDALLPVLASFAVTIASLPLLALIWGARVTDLTELWTTAGQGFAIGGTVITPTNFLTFAVVFVIGYTLTRLVQGMLKTTILPKTKIDLGGRNAITSGVGYVGLFLAAVVAITSAGFDLSSLAIVAGALSVGIGFGLQNVVSNFVSGIILLIERPISEGDWIEVGGRMGYVRDISVRSTRIETFDRSDVIVPNSDLISGVVTNYTRGNSIGRVIVPVGVAYGTDTRRVEAILREVAQAHPMVTVNPAPSVVLQGFGADSLDFEIRAILRDVNYVLSVKSDMNHEIARRFTEEGIEIPFAQRDVWLRNPEALGSGAEAFATAAAMKTSTHAARETLDESDLQNTSNEGVGEGDD